MLRPKQTKFQKAYKGSIRGNDPSGTRLKFGTIGLKALEPARVTATQLEAARRLISPRIKKVGKLWIRVFPNIPVTTKPSETRMGKGKGSVDLWVGRVKPGTILFELEATTFRGSGIQKLSLNEMKKALLIAAQKFPFKCKLLVRNEYTI